MSDEPIERGDEILPGNPPTGRAAIAWHSHQPLDHRGSHGAADPVRPCRCLPALFFLTDALRRRADHAVPPSVDRPGPGGELRSLAWQFWRLNLWNRTDLDWTLHMGDLVAGPRRRCPRSASTMPARSSSSGRWRCLILAMFCSGIVIWDRYFEGFDDDPGAACGPAQSTRSVRRFDILVLILHVYAGDWVRGSFDAMIHGWVSAGWAWRHHRLWFRRLAARQPTTGPAE